MVSIYRQRPLPPSLPPRGMYICENQSTAVRQRILPPSLPPSLPPFLPPSFLTFALALAIFPASVNACSSVFSFISSLSGERSPLASRAGGREG